MSVAASSSSAPLLGHPQADQTSYPFSLPDLPYKANALEPYLTAEMFSFHHGKHHNSYVVNLNQLVKEKGLEGKSLEQLIHETAGDPTKLAIFNNAAQIWNHTFYWHSMTPGGGGKPIGALAQKIDQDFGNLDGFKDAFKQAAVTQFGSGWAWLVLDKHVLKIVKTGNAELPLTQGLVPLLTVDVWEHAYYIDYQNRRPDYVTSFLEHLVNWQFASQNFAKATGA
jgi:Fe-Mn family superoxide dismutase